MMYEIFEDNMPRLKAKLTHIENKCHKYGCEFHFEELGEVFHEVMVDHNPLHKVTVRYIQVEVSGMAKVNNWEFVATIEHSKPVNVVRSFRPEVEIPVRYFTADPICEHCNTRRYRKDTYLIRNTETGEFKQVGKSCLMDFTNGLSAEAVAQYISWFDELIKGQSIEGSSYKCYYDVAEILQYAVEAVRLYGYTKTYSEGVSTKEIVMEQKFETGDYNKRIEEDHFDVNHRGNKERTEAILGWVSTLEDDYGYLTNLKAICTKDFCESRDFGFICSAVVTYDREVEKKVRKASQCYCD